METENEHFCNNCKRHVSAANFATHSAFCERNIFVCKICDEPVQISEKNQHLEEYHVIFPCDLCETAIEKWMLPKHMESCPKRLLQCQYCEASFSADEYPDHVKFCESRTEKCLLCQKYIMNKDKSKHNEIHVLEERYHTKNIKEEIKQNKVNEVVSNRSAMESIPKKTSENIDDKNASKVNEGGGACFLDAPKSKIRKEDQNHEIEAHTGAVASLPEKGKEISKHYTQCHICKEVVPWIDYNTHLPNCASSSGKCSLCGEKVLSHALKDHMKKHFQQKLENQFKVPQNYESYSETTYRNDEDYVAENEVNNEAIFECPYCSQQCSKDRILDHTRNCSKNVFECKLCCKRVPEKDRISHETSECRMLQDTDEIVGQSFLRSSQNFYDCPLCSMKVPEEKRDRHTAFGCKMLFDTSGTDGFYGVGDDSYTYECPYCSEKIPRRDKDKHQSFYCKFLIENSGVTVNASESYADVTKKSWQSDCKSHQLYEFCPTCKNRFDKSTITEHKSNCHRLKLPCQFCSEMIDPSCEDIHLQFCTGMKNYKNLQTRVPQNSKLSNNEYKGAIPKSSNIQEMMRPRSAKCLYCRTTYNAEILRNHEDECLYRPMQCNNCSIEILMKDIDSHKCKRKKGKGKNQKMERQTSEEQGAPNFLKRTMKYLFTDVKEEAKNKHVYTQSPYCYRRNDHVSGDARNKEKLYFEQMEDPLLPCEFCQKEIPASELVLHETGCQPHLVSYAKADSPEKSMSNKSNSKQDHMKEKSAQTSKSQNISAIGARSPFFTGNKSFIPSAAYEHIEHSRESNAKAGEFLQGCYDKNSSIHQEHSKSKENNAEVKKSEPLKLQSLWNAGSSNDLRIGDYDPKEISDHSDVEMDVDNMIDNTLKNENQKEDMKEFNEQVSEKQTLGDNEMSDVLKFLNVQENLDSDDEYVSLSDENGEPENPNMEMCNVMHSKDNTQKQHFGDLSVSRKLTIDEESENIYHNTLKGITDAEKLREEYGKHMADFRINAPKPRTCEDNAHYAVQSEKDHEELEKVCKQKSSKCVESSEDREKHVISTRNLADFKFGAHRSTTLSEDNVHCVIQPKEKYEEHEKLYKPKISKYIERSKNQKEHVSSLKYQADFKLGRQESAAHFGEDKVHAKNDEGSKIFFKHKVTEYYDNCSDQKGYANSSKQLANFELRTYESAAVLHDKENAYCPVRPEKNLGEPKKLYNQKNQRSTVSTKDGKESYSNFKFHTEVSTTLSDEENERHKISPEKNKESDKKTSRYIDSTMDNMEYIRNFKQHLPDFKFGVFETKSESSEYNVGNSRLPEKKSDHNRAFMVEPAGSQLKETQLLFQTVTKKEGLEEKIAALQNMNKKKLNSVADDENDIAKWKKWRGRKHYESSGSD